ncbi:MAG TPA: SpoIID/LytB domain-containing protein [Anaerohalosphaeraceae bacterium]|nr:SpoIID/LytB domain-containing protein [Phycisphaerae bacterium]HOK94529.1 SpoIID/LytB domain-containing protein [Anaerohalosphaeraceae bacterium]HOL31751.1 SpoIID/LytB domain-containing protein [Anaerohalosphaeraceae bacterium]HOM74994.1 SpoIID/LytB domain-containing protein [Anaerohalosphaeraceae bacterium]HPC63245.1 SpoIID/LytB domain-containing protein [Anaerohalosphaeraceae bacterium]
MKGIRRLTAYRSAALWACMVCMLLPAGCRQRSPEPTVGTERPIQEWMRVLLFGNLRECSVASLSGFRIEDIDGGSSAEFMTSAPIQIRHQDGFIQVGDHFFGRQILIKPNAPYVVFEIDGKAYRGYLRLHIRMDEAGMEVINEVPLESYLFGVVGAEMQSYWEPEALKAQAVVSRTYGLYIKSRFGALRSWDLTQSEANQVYRGIEAETPSVRQAVLETAGQILIGKWADGSESLFPAYYSSSCGGHTEAAQNVFGGSAAVPLSGVLCPYCKEIARRKDFHWPNVTLTKRQIFEGLTRRYESLEKLEGIEDFEISRVGFLGRVTQVRLLGKNGKTDTLRGEDFRLSLDPTGRKIKSAVFTVDKNADSVVFRDGLGFGHGVGLCQCGAQGMARQGYTYQEILDFYFPGSKQVAIETSKE